MLSNSGGLIFVFAIFLSWDEIDLVVRWEIGILLGFEKTKCYVAWNCQKRNCYVVLFDGWQLCSGVVCVLPLMLNAFFVWSQGTPIYYRFYVVSTVVVYFLRITEINRKYFVYEMNTFYFIMASLWMSIRLLFLLVH